MTDYRAVNLASWDERAPAHAASADYGVARFTEDPAFLSDVVRFDLPLLGDISGLRGVHLQCHIGTDTISLDRLGATMTGLDFSPAALAEARRLAGRVGAGVNFVEADVYDAVTVLGAGRFDLVYTGIGALCWLPGIARWAGVVGGLLRPGGRLFLREGHPMLWSLASARPDGLTQNVTHEWNHGLGEIVTALQAAGMELTGLAEHDSAPWEALPGQMERTGGGEWRLADRPWRLPCTYTLQAVKPAAGGPARPGLAQAPAGQAE
jgi:SAM-dependent methyltransferase